MLPSEALEKASTFDLYVLDVHYKHLKHQNDKNNDKPDNKALSNEEMLEMMNKVRESHRQKQLSEVSDDKN